ncbi:MAG: peptidase U34 [Clostridia bacterium]
MCDTLVALPSVTRDGSLIFAKNSDRSPNEPLVTVRIPAKDYDMEKEPMLKLTYISIPQVPHTHEVVLMKPSWMWGAEMGFNEFGLNIGNEAVFTIENRRRQASLTGMDMVRLALERTADAKSALDYMVMLLGEYGQGGNCGYNSKFYYHNSFLIADRTAAYVLETAGKFYAIKKVEDYYAISNCLSIGDDYDYIHSGAIKNARTKKRARVDTAFDFQNSYTDRLYTHFAKSRERRSLAMTLLERDKGNITVESVMNILRAHSQDKQEDGASVSSVCMHAGGFVGDHTTGSYIAEITGNADNYYIAATSLPCLSIYLPLVFANKMPIGEDEERAKENWVRAEMLHRYILSGQINRAEYVSEKTKIEQKHLSLFAQAANEKEKLAVSFAAFEEADNFIKEQLSALNGAPYKFKLGSFGYRRYWTRKTKSLLKNS